METSFEQKILDESKRGAPWTQDGNKLFEVIKTLIHIKNEESEARYHAGIAQGLSDSARMKQGESLIKTKGGGKFSYPHAGQKIGSETTLNHGDFYP